MNSFRALGPTTQKWTSIGLGTWMMESDPKGSISALRRGIEMGANHVDTAEMYGDGRVEEIVGEALQGIRKKVFLVSKVLPSNADYKGTLAACDRSLKRLKTDFLDVYLLHWRETNTRIEEAFKAFEKLKQDGKIRAWGVSNFDVADMEEAVKLVGEGKIVCNQVLYHLKERAIETNLLPWCESHNVALVAYSPFGQGKIPKSSVLGTIAKAHNATITQVILAFLTKNPSTFAIPKSADLKRTEDNVKALNLTLSDEEIEQINQDFPLKSRRSLPMI